MKNTLQRLVCACAIVLPSGGVLAASEEWDVNVSPDWGYGYQDIFGTVPISARDFQVYGETLNLTGDQAELAGELYADFAEEMRNISTLTIEKRTDMQALAQASEDWQEFQKATSNMSRDQNEKTRDMTAHLFADLQLIITPEQESTWASVERTRRRRETLARFSVYPRERIDLVAIVQGIEMPESFRKSLIPTLDEYEYELDVALTARNTKASAAVEKTTEINTLQMTAWSRTTDPDPQAIMAAQSRIEELQQEIIPVALGLRDASARVRDVNDRYTRELASRFPTKLKQRLEEQTAKIAGKDQNAVPFSDFSRAKIAIQTLEQLEAMKPMMEMQAQMFGDSDMAAEMKPYLDRLKTVQPLSEDQRDQLALIKTDIEAELLAAQRRHGRPSAPADEPASYTFKLDGAVIQLTRRGEEQDNMNMLGQQEPSRADKKQAKDLAKINQNAIDRIRAILTIEQRSVIAQF